MTCREPSWKTNPDIVAEESFKAGYVQDDEPEEEPYMNGRNKRQSYSMLGRIEE